MPEWDEDTSVTEAEELTRPPAPAHRDRAYLIVLVGSAVGEMYKLPAQDAVIGRTRQAAIRIEDDGVSRVHAVIRADGDHLMLEDRGSRNGTFVNGRRVIGSCVLADGDKIQVGRTTILKFTYHDALDESFHERMYESALRDGLTHVYNKRYFRDRLDGELRFALRHGTALAVLMIDIDHFKRINDQHGHVAGDAVLAEVAARIAGAVRNEDVVARFGGEEFAIISRATKVAEAVQLAERLRRTIGARPVVLETGTPQAVTVSIGVAAYPETMVTEPDELIAAADRALYRAKEAGRDRVARAE